MITMAVRGIRGATVVAENTAAAIVAETKTLLQALLTQNQIDIDQIASIFFSVTADLNAEFPAVAAREIGLVHTPLFCLSEIPVPHALPRCIRILIHLNTDKSQQEMIHVYLKEAQALRPDTQKGPAT